MLSRRGVTARIRKRGPCFLRRDKKTRSRKSHSLDNNARSDCRQHAYSSTYSRSYRASTIEPCWSDERFGQGTYNRWWYVLAATAGYAVSTWLIDHSNTDTVSENRRCFSKPKQCPCTWHGCFTLPKRCQRSTANYTSNNHHRYIRGTQLSCLCVSDVWA